MKKNVTGDLDDREQREQKERTVYPVTELLKLCSNSADYDVNENENENENDNENNSNNASKNISLAKLMSMDLPATRWIVEHWLPKGLAVLVAPPKSGKSFMALDLAIDVASGIPFMGQRTNKCGVLYLALEDTMSRVQDRATSILKGVPFTDSCEIWTESPRLNEGLIDVLEIYLAQNPETGLIIIDTLQQIRDGQRENRYSYASDYHDLKILKKFADDHNICVIAIHHTRKQRDHSDPFNDISGTNGIMGAVDTIWVIEKNDRTDDEAVLSITGRDVVQDQLIIHFDGDDFRWHLTGRTEEILKAKARIAYDESPIVKTIKTLVYRSNDWSWTGSMTDLMYAGKEVCKTTLAPTPSKLSRLVSELSDQLKENDGISHVRHPNGQGGGKHTFRLSREPDEEEQTSLDVV